jgi:hypothetical protein
LPAGIATDDTTKDFFQRIVESKTLLSIFHFENEERLFAGVNNMFRFVLLTLGGAARKIEAADVVAFARNREAIVAPSRRYRLSAAEIETLNPNTRTFPTFLTRRDADLTLTLYRRAGVLWRESEPNGNPWGLHFMSMLHMTSDSGLFRTAMELEAAGWTRDGNQYVLERKRMLPLLEAKMVHQFDHRFATYDGATQANLNKGTLPQTTDAQHSDADFQSTPQYWVAEAEVEARLGRWERDWLLGWRDITNAHNERTVIASLFPRSGVGNTASLAFTERDPRVSLPRVLELTYTAWDLEPSPTTSAATGHAFRWDPARRTLLRAELDAAFFHLYGQPRRHRLHPRHLPDRPEERREGPRRVPHEALILEVYDAGT